MAMGLEQSAQGTKIEGGVNSELVSIEVRNWKYQQREGREKLFLKHETTNESGAHMGVVQLFKSSHKLSRSYTNYYYVIISWIND